MLTTILLSGAAGGVITWFGGLAAKQKLWPLIAAALKRRSLRIAANAEAAVKSKALAYETEFRAALITELRPIVRRLRAVEERVGVAPRLGQPSPEQQQQQQGGGA
jgi:hypothetical protein